MRRHAVDVLPGETALVGERMAAKPAWDAAGPKHLIYGDLSRNRRILRKALDATFTRGRPEAEVVAFLKENGCEAFLSEFLEAFLPYLRPVRKAGVRWYSFGHGFDVSARLEDPKWARRLRVHQEADGVFVRAEVLKERVIDRLGLDPARVHVVRGGIDVPSKFLRRSEKLEVRAISVGRMVPKKGPLETLQAVEKALKAVPMLKFEWIGDGPLFTEAKAYVWAHELDRSVTLHGAKPPEFVQERLAAADLYVQHSRRDPSNGDEEGLPASITEAMALGLPVVSTRHAGIPEAVLEGEQGYLVAEGDVEGMAERLVAVAKDFDLRLRLGEAGWKRAGEVFSWPGERARLRELMGL